MNESLAFVLQYLIFPLVISFCSFKWSNKDR